MRPPVLDLDVSPDVDVFYTWADHRRRAAHRPQRAAPRVDPPRESEYPGDKGPNEPAGEWRWDERKRA